MEDVEGCLEYTKCDGIMSSEAVYENPALFDPNPPSQVVLLSDHFLLEIYIDKFCLLVGFVF